MYNWFFVQTQASTQQVSYVMYYCPSGGIFAWEQFPTPSFSGSALFPTVGADGAVMVASGSRLYAAFYINGGRLSQNSGQVYGALVGLDNLFAAPLVNAIAASETGAGVVTAGLHRIGYVFTTRNGYTGRLCPVDSNGNFAPISFTSAGSKNLQLQISGAIPSYLQMPATPGGSVFQIVMTVVGQPDTYYAVPGAFATCANPTTITINIDDYDLAATGTDFTSYQLLLASSISNVPPFYPSDIFAYSSRMCYITVDQSGFPVCYISEPNAYQYITADQHGIYLEGNQQMIAGFSLRGVCYLGTQSAFYSCEDSGDVPVNWTPPQKVDGSIGVQSPTNITVNPSLGYAAIAANRGFYIFQGGIFPALPLSYYQQPDWQRINWQIPSQVQVVDDQLNKRFIVLAPLMCYVASSINQGTNLWLITTSVVPFGPTDQPNLLPSSAGVDISGSGVGLQYVAVISPNSILAGYIGTPTIGAAIRPQQSTHQLTWDYTSGDTPETIKYSLNSMGNIPVTGSSGSALGYCPGAVCIVETLPNALQEVWYAPHSENFGGGAFIRQCDGSEQFPYRDYDISGVYPTPINWIYETNLIPGVDDQSATIHFYYGMHFRAFGTAPVSFVVNGLDDNPSIVPVQSPKSITSIPGQEYLVTWSIFSEQQSIQFSTATIDQYCTLSLIRCYYSNQYSQR